MNKIYAVNTLDFYLSLAGVFLLLLVLLHFFPGLVPFGLYQLLFFKYSWVTMKTIPWTLLFFGPVVTLLFRLFSKSPKQANRDVLRQFDYKIWTSIKAGIFEEIAFRWLLFFYLIIVFTLDNLLLNWLSTVGFISAVLSLPWWALGLVLLAINLIAMVAYALGVDKKTSCTVMILSLFIVIPVFLIDLTVILALLKVWYVVAAIPIINFLTLGKLAPQLLGYSWMVGAALITSNWRFGNGHASQGPIGWLDALIFGMLMFWFTFNFGLFFAMLIHAAYDILVNLIVAGDAALELAIT